MKDVLWLVGVMAAVVGVVMFVQWLATRARRGEFARLAGRLGLKLRRGAGKALLERVHRLPLFAKLRDRRIRHVIEGERDGKTVRLFDYARSGAGEPDQHPPGASVALIELPDAGFPRFMLRPEGLADRIAAAAGFEDIDFESDEFSRQFYVTCDERRFAFDVITAKQMEFLLSLDELCVEARGPFLAFHRRAVLSPPELEWLHGVALRFVSNIPDFVFERAEGASGKPA
ncbi:MAG: hypothetical protein ACYS9X_00815 [Planctomycetota bacterium]|jgi:hypothetical protein